MPIVKAYGALLVIAVTWPFLVPGEAFALRDMMVFDQMALTQASLGYGDLAARNVPQDALLGILPRPVLAVRAVMVGAAITAATCAYRLGRTPLGQAAAMTVVLWNPFVVERLLQGHWSLVAAAWLLPAVAGSVFAQWLASLTPTGALAAACFSRRPLVSLLSCAPWVVAGLFFLSTSTATPTSTSTFAPRAEAWVGTLGALLGLGGMWNAEAAPPSRSLGFAVFGVALFVVLALGWRAVPRQWLALAGVGFAVPLLAWAGLLGPVVEHVPGGGLLRDAQKWVMLALPAMTAAAGALNARRAFAALSFALLQVPDAPLAVSALAPAAVGVPAVDHRGRDVLFVDRPTLVEVRGVPTVDPAPKAMNVVENGALIVDGVEVDAPSARWVAAQDAAARGDAETLRELGVGVVVLPEGSVWETGAPARDIPPLGIALFALWCCTPALCVTDHRELPNRSYLHKRPY